MISSLTIKTTQREEMVDVTALIRRAVADSDLSSGLVFCFVPHTTAGLTINENADPDVQRDLLNKLAREIPREDGYLHAEGNSDAHLKASLMGSSLQVLVEDGELILGTWQGIYFCEFDGPRSRRLLVKAASFG